VTFCILPEPIFAIVKDWFFMLGTNFAICRENFCENFFRGLWGKKAKIAKIRTCKNLVHMRGQISNLNFGNLRLQVDF